METKEYKFKPFFSIGAGCPLAETHASKPPKDSGREHLGKCLTKLDRIEQEVAKVHVPMSYADQLYALRFHIELAREKLLAEMAETQQAPAE